MSTTKTPLELVNSIKKHTVALFELRRVSKALLEATSMEDVEVTRTIVRSIMSQIFTGTSQTSSASWKIICSKRQKTLKRTCRL